MSELERRAVQRVLDRAADLGVPVPAGLSTAGMHAASYPAGVWAQQHPDDDRPPCCFSSLHDPTRCVCWRPVHDVEQAPPRTVPLAQVDQAPRMCGDCAYRPDSKERTDPLLAEELMGLPAEGELFWCHQGMRRPARWVHPDGRQVPGSADDWQPPIVDGIPYQADGSPALLCAGWAARCMAAAREKNSADG